MAVPNSKGPNSIAGALTTTLPGGSIVAFRTYLIPPEWARITVESLPADARQSPNIATAPLPVRAVMARTVARSLRDQRVKQNNTSAAKATTAGRMVDTRVRIIRDQSRPLHRPSSASQESEEPLT